MNPYQILGIEPDSELHIVKSRYHRLMLKYHPDKAGDSSLEKCKEINTAYREIMRDNPDEELDIPQPFRDLGFKAIPTLHEYIGRALQRILTEAE